MSKEVLFLRGIDQDSDSVDDTVLLDDYDNHFSSVKKKVLRRMGYSNPEIESILKLVCKQKKKKSPKSFPNWSVGAHCCSIFSEDGKTYEATVTALFPDKEMCRVQYVGYNNEEEVPLVGLTQSRGRKAREAQMFAATGVEFTNAECSEHCSEEDSTQEAEVPQQKGKPSKNNKHKRSQQQQQQRASNMDMQFPSPELNMNMLQFPPPSSRDMPPVMPGMVPPMPFNTMANGNSEHTEALSAMLMSWYMSGYYTGYYDALNIRRKQNHRK